MKSIKKTYLILGTFLIVLILLLFFLGEIVVPFILAVFLSFILNPIIEKIQTKIKNRSLSVISFLLGIFLLISTTTLFLGNHIIEDSQRFVSSVEIFMEKNGEKIKNFKKELLSIIDDKSNGNKLKDEVEKIEKDFNKPTEKEDSKTEKKDSEETIVSALETIYKAFTGDESGKVEPKTKSWSLIYIFTYLIIYTVIILYTYDYFEDIFNKFLKHKKLQQNGFFKNFKTLFIDYFRQRTKVVFLSTLIFIVGFSILDLPGGVIIGIIAGLLTYASEFHYLSLPLTLVGCWVLSVEQNSSFLIFFAAVLFIYILVSILEETFFSSKIMKSVRGMNPAITILAFAIWTTIFGDFVGTVIALPLTQIIMIYGKSMIMYLEEENLIEARREKNQD